MEAEVQGEKEIMQNFQQLKKNFWDFPGGPVVKTLRFHCQGREFDPWSGS